MSTIIGEISIPADDQGFVLMQCPLCGEFFKIKPEEALLVTIDGKGQFFCQKKEGKRG